MFPKHVWWIRSLIFLVGIFVTHEAIAKTDDNLNFNSGSGTTIACSTIDSPSFEKEREHIYENKYASSNSGSFLNQSPYIFGNYLSSGNNTLSGTDVNTKITSDIELVAGVNSVVQGNSTQDFVNNRYIYLTNLGVTVYNMSTLMFDFSQNIPSGYNNYTGLEYKSNTNSVLGTYNNGASVILSTFNTTTKLFSNIGTIPGVNAVVQGVSTFDQANGYYITSTNLGITVINSLNALVVKNIPIPVSYGSIKGLEYDPKSKRVFGTYWNGSQEILVSVNLITNTISNIGVIPGVTGVIQGNSSFDAANGQYLFSTNLGITLIDITTGAINCTVAGNIQGLEYSNTPPGQIPLLLLTSASNVTLECDGSGNLVELGNFLSTNGGATATNGCGGVTWSHDFTVFPYTCGAAGKITVVFTATDACNQCVTSSATFTINDNIAPVIDCNLVSDLTVECESATADAEIQAWVDASIATLSGSGTDDCSGTLTGSSNFNPININTVNCNTSLDVIFTVSDDCGNKATCTNTITVVGPMECIGLTCDPMECRILNTQEVIIPANDFIVEIFDDCGGSGPYTRQVARLIGGPCNDPTDTTFGPSVSFCCADIGTIVMVVVKVLDADGNFGFCMSEVEVKDNTKPTITSCPPDMMANCSDGIDINDLSQFGQVVATDNCTTNLSIMEDINTDNLNDCGIGVIVRTWIVSDNGGNTTSCSQTLTVVNDQPGQESDITWPADIIQENICNVFVPGPEDTGFPIYSNNVCAQFIATYSDDTSVIGPGCQVTTRHWKVIDWCQFSSSADPSTYKWEYFQTLTIINTKPPVFDSCQALVESCGNEQTCTGMINLSVSATDDCTMVSGLSYVYTLYLEGGGIINGTGNTISSSQPYGEHTIVWTVSDQCGNNTNCSQTVKIRDCKAPEAICIYGVNINLTQSPLDNAPQALLWATDLDASSSDNCTPTLELEFAFNPDFTQPSIVLGCGDVGNDVPVVMYVRDADGNVGFCKTYIGVQDNHELCPVGNIVDPSPILVSGRVATEDAFDLHEVDVMLENSSDEMHHMTDEEGLYAFANLPMYEHYKLSPSYEGDILNGLTTLDIIQIQRHVLGLEALSSPYKIIAADVNMSENISAADIIEIRKVILGKQDKFSKAKNWRFVDSGLVFPDPSDPFPINEIMNLPNLDHDADNMNFVGIKSGDVNNSIVLEGFIPETPSNRSLRNLVLSSKNLERGLIQITVNKATKITGFQISFQSSRPVNLIEIKSNLIDVSDGNFSVSNNIIKLSWSSAEAISLQEGAELFNMQFSGDVDLDLYYDHNNFTTEAYDDSLASMQVIMDANKHVSENEWSVFSNTPNPFSDKTSIPFIAPIPANVQLTVFDLHGKIIYQESKDVEKGFQRWDLSSNDFGNVHGVLYYRFESGDYSSTHPFIKLN